MVFIYLFLIPLQNPSKNMLICTEGELVQEEI